MNKKYRSIKSYIIDSKPCIAFMYGDVYEKLDVEGETDDGVEYPHVFINREGIMHYLTDEDLNEYFEKVEDK